MRATLLRLSALAGAFTIVGCIGQGGGGGDGNENADAGDDVGLVDATVPGGDAGVEPSYNYYLYSGGGQGLRSFSIDAQSLVPANRVDASAAVSLSMAVDPQARFLFAAELRPAGGYDYTTYAIDAVTGRLTRGSSVSSNDVFTYVMAVNPAGTLLFVGDVDNNRVSSYSIAAATGALTLVNSVNVSVSGSSYNEMQVHPSGSRLYVAGDTSLQTVTVSATGQLTASTSFPDASIGTVHLSQDAKFLYTGPQGTGSIDSYTVDPNTGALTYLRSIATGDAEVSRIATDPGGRFLYASSRTGTVLGYSVAADGSLSPRSTTPVTDGASQPADLFSMSMHPTAHALYAHGRGGATDGGDVVYVFAVDPGTGAISRIGSPIAGIGRAFNTRAVQRAQP